MRQCQSCGKQNPDDQDFCSCGEYLRWEPTGYYEAVKPPEDPEAVSPPPVTVTPAEPVQPENGNGHAAPPPPPPPPPTTAAQLPAVAPPKPTPVARPVHQTLVRGAVPTARQAEPEQQVPATITLRLPDGDYAKGEALHQAVEPGQRERVLAMVRNQSGIVDNYDLRVEGMPEEWWSIFPGTVYLVPFGAGGTYEQEVEIHLHPPRGPEADAREWELKVVADSKAHRVVAAWAPLALHIQPYIETTTTLRPQRKKGRRKATFDVTVGNKANAPVVVALDGEDPDGELSFGFNRPPQEIPPGGVVTTQMQVRPPKQIWIGRSRDRQLSVATVTGEEAAERAAAEPLAAAILENAPPPKKKRFWQRRPPHVPGMYPPRVYKPQLYAPDVQMGPGGLQVRMPKFKAPQVQGPRMGSVNAGQLAKGKLKLPGRGGPAAPGAPMLPTQGFFRQRPWITWWLPLLLVLLVVLLLLLYKLFAPHNTVVPDVVGQKSAFAAEEVLTKSHLKLDPSQKTKVDDRAQAGSVLSQTPAKGSDVKKDSTVTILIAVGSGKVNVPKVVGQTAAEADKTLRGKTLTLGQSSPTNADPKATISSQIPAEGEIVKAGTPVNIFYPDPTDPAKQKDKGKDGGKKGKPGAPGGPGTAPPGGGAKDIVVPAVEGKDTVETYAKKAADLGIVPSAAKQFNDAPVGKVVGTTPTPGTKVAKGAKLKVLVSAGQPQVIFTNGKDIKRINGANGAPLDPVAKTSADEEDPTWTADGQHVAFTSDNRVMLKDITKKNADAVPLTKDGEKFENLAWAPTVDTQVLAMNDVKDGSDDSDLCLAHVQSSSTDVSCLTEPKFAVTRAIHWAFDGRTILALGVKLPAGQGIFGIVRWKLKAGAKPFSSDVGDWGKGKFVTDTKTAGKGVLDAAISPDGKRLALATNLGSSAYRLALTEAGDYKMKKAVKTTQRACKVAWRGDGQALLLIQGDAACSEDVAALVRVDANATRNERDLNAAGDDGAFQPLTLGG